MDNDQNLARARHLEDVANGAKRYILAEILDVTQAVANELESIGGASYSVFTGATNIAGGTSGLVPAPSIGDENYFLRGDGNWASVSSGGGGDYSVFTGAGLSAAGLSGLVPAPSIGDQMHFLRGDGVWASVGRDPCTLTIPENSGTVGKNGTITFSATSTGDGKIFATSSDTSIATVEVSGNTVTITGVDYGTTTITVSQAQGFDYAAPPDVTYTVTVQPQIGATLNDTAWDVISTVSQAGTGDTYWDVGDWKEITLNGKVGNNLTLTNEKLRVFILHFNYALNCTADNNIIWGGFKNADGTDVALCDSLYNTTSTDGTICFNMNHWGNSRYGGWKGCDLRYDILGATSTQPSEYGQAHTASCVGYDATAATLTNPKANTLLAALPADFRDVLRLWSRWIDAKGGSNVEENIEETIDAVTLLTEWEVQGTRTWANQYEQNHQRQMDYYKNGNSKIKYNPAATTTPITCWASSAYCWNSYAFATLATQGGSYYNDAKYSHAIAPAFMT